MVTRLRKELKGLKEGGLLTEQLRRPLGTVYATRGGAHPSPKRVSGEDCEVSRWNRSNELIRRDCWTSDQRIREGDQRYGGGTEPKPDCVKAYQRDI